MGAARPPVAVSTGVYSQFPDYATPEWVADGMARLDADAYEVLVFRSWADPVAAAETLRGAGRPVAVVHGEKRIGGLLGSPDLAERRRGQELVLEAVEVARILGAPWVNLHVWDLPGSDHHLEQNLEALAEVLPEAARRGVGLLAETIPCQRGVPWRNVQRILEFCDAVGVPGPPVGVNLDLEFLAWHGGLDVTLDEWVPRWGPRLGNVHVKDHDGQPFVGGRRRYVNPGDGAIDFARAFARLAEAGYRGPLTFEGNVTAAGDREAVLAATRTYLDRIRRWADVAWGCVGG